MQISVVIHLLTGIARYTGEKDIITIERNNHCVIVYDESAGRCIAFSNTEDKDAYLYVQELQERAQVLKSGIILVPLLFDTKYKENSRPMQIFLTNHSIKSILQEDSIATELYGFYFAHAIPQIIPAGVSYIFCM